MKRKKPQPIPAQPPVPPPPQAEKPSLFSRADTLAETGAVSCALLLDYYVRVGDLPLDQIPQVQAELDRIWDDYRFLQSGVIWSQVAQRMADYKKMKP